MAYLWDRPEDDEQFEKAEWLRENTDADEDYDECIGKDYRALCMVYYDVFNNGGCNLPMPIFQGLIQRLRQCGVSYGLNTPQFCEVTDEIIDGKETYDVIDPPEMDQFARDLIENLWATLNPEINLG